MLAVKERELQRLRSGKSRESIPFATLLKRPEITFESLKEHGYQPSPSLNRDVASRIELAIKYEGYLKRAQEEIERFSSSEDILLPADIDYLSISTLATEAREKLAKIRPRNLAQALRVPGVNYTDASALMVWLRKNKDRR
jgi:tRNA uridine 5-carboxymethylaminomethyl modification enzyme